MIEIFKGEQDTKSYYTIPATMTKKEALLAVARDRKVSPDKLMITKGTIKRKDPDVDRLYIEGTEGKEKVWVIVRK
jgi:hypothetical protein